MAVTKIKPIKSTLKKALDYIQNPDKTDGKMLVSSFGCSYETADIEFGFTLSQALDRGNKDFFICLVGVLDIVKGFAQRAFNRLNLCNRHISASTPFISSMSSW